MRFSAISSRVKLWVSSSTVDGSWESADVGRSSGCVLVALVPFIAVPGWTVGPGGTVPVAGRLEAALTVPALLRDRRKTLPKELRSEVLELGTAAGLRLSARSLSTAALRRYAMAVPRIS